MQKWIPVRRASVIATVALTTIGCNDTTTSPEVVKERPIKQVGDVYRNVLRDTQKPPASRKDLNRYAQMAPAGCKAVNDGSVKVYWGVQLADLADAPSTDSADEVLAYEKDVPTQGGSVLMKNRSIRTMTSAEFETAAKPAGATTDDAAPTRKK